MTPGSPRSTRADFSARVIALLARRAAYRCSNPACRALTMGPSVRRGGVINLGVAAHIVGASSQGPRGGGALSERKRRDLGNGIWLCQNCGNLVDSDQAAHTVRRLQNWKSEREREARQELGRPTGAGASSTVHFHQQFPRRLVLMDSALEHNVYDPEDFQYGRTNADSIRDILKKFPYLIMKELTNLRWNAEDHIVRFNPHLIVIHLSCFYERTRFGDSGERFRGFLEYMRQATDVRFLIYTRAVTRTDGARVRRLWNKQCAMYSRKPWTDFGRLLIIPSNRASFRDRRTA